MGGLPYFLLGPPKCLPKLRRKLKRKFGKNIYLLVQTANHNILCNFHVILWIFFLANLFFYLFNRSMKVNLYKQYFLTSSFSSQPNKWVFQLSTFPSSQANTHERKLNIFYPLTFLSLFHFLYPPTFLHF